MRIGLAPLEGAQRARLTEEQWAAVVAAHADERGGLPGAVAPMAGAGAASPEGDLEVDPEVGHATALLSGSAPVRVEVRSRQGEVGVLGLIASDGAVCAHVIRRLDASGSEPALVPGVELGVYGVERLADEVLRLLPPPPTDLPDPALTGPVEVELPLEASLMLSRAVADADHDLAHEVARLAGLEEVPPLVESLATRLSGEAGVGTTVPGARSGALRSWLLCSLGWVAVELRGDRVVHRLVTAEDVRADLVFDLTGALDRALGAGTTGARHG